MKRGKILFVAVLSAVVAATILVPDLRLASELAAAKREGLWTTAADVRRAIGAVAKRDNAAPLIWKAIKDDRAEGKRIWPAQAEWALVAEGRASPAQRLLARKALPSLDATLARWRAASERPRLDYGRRYEDGYRTLFPELAGIKAGALRLVAAASLGGTPKENLRAAARLSALVRQEPGPIPQLVGLEIGKSALREAARRDMEKEIAAALGAAPDVRRILGPELPGLLDIFSLSDYEASLSDLGVKHSIGFSERLSHWGPMAKATKATGIARWRHLWTALPKDGTDLDAAARVVDAEMPAIDALTPTVAAAMGKLSSRGGGRGEFLRDLAMFERRRKKALGRP